MRLLTTLPNGLFFSVNNGGQFDAARGIFRKPGKWYVRGVADVIGVYRGIPVAMELKSQKGKPSEHQDDFLRRFAAAGGVCGIVRSISDALQILRAADRIADSRQRADHAQE